MTPVFHWFPDWTPCLFQQLGVWKARQFCYNPVRKGALQSSSPIFQDGTQTSLMWLSTYKVVQSDFFSWHPPPLKMALDWHSPPSPRFSELESHLLWQTLRRFSIRGVPVSSLPRFLSRQSEQNFAHQGFPGHNQPSWSEVQKTMSRKSQDFNAVFSIRNEEFGTYCGMLRHGENLEHVSWKLM